MIARVFSVQRFCLHDGPGVRTTVFLAGCPLTCRWCHNPEGQLARTRILLHPEKCIGCGLCKTTGCGHQLFSPSRAIDREKCTGCGRCVEVCPAGALEKTVYDADTDELIAQVLADKPFFGDRGGLTLSGGEPFSQPASAIDLLEKARAAGITTAVETSGAFDPSILPEAVPLTDLFLWDWKDSDKDRLKQNTGADRQRIEDNLRLADALGARLRLRCLLVHGVNTDENHALGIRKLAESLRGLQGIDLLKYHPMGESKVRQLGKKDDFDSIDKIPTEEELALFRGCLTTWL